MVPDYSFFKKLFSVDTGFLLFLVTVNIPAFTSFLPPSYLLVFIGWCKFIGILLEGRQLVHEDERTKLGSPALACATYAVHLGFSRSVDLQVSDHDRE